MSAAPKISVIIVNYNAGEWLAKCAASVAAQTMADFECFIVDNGSTDGSLETLPELDARFEIIKAGENLGFAAGNNLAAKRARGDWLALLNPDAFARDNWLEHLLAATELLPNTTMVGSTQMMALEPNVYDGAGDCYHVFGLAWRALHGWKTEREGDVINVETCEVFGPCAAAALYERTAFLRAEGFDESFFCYHEDVDLALRLQLAGGRCVQSAEAIVDHVSSGISGRASDFAVYHGTRNRIWTFAKSMPSALLWISVVPFIVLNLALLGWAAFRRGRLAPTWRGVKDGVTGLQGIGARRGLVQATRSARLLPLLRIMTLNPFAPLTRDLSAHPIPRRKNISD